MPNFYDDNKLLIATSIEELGLYFGSLNGNKSVQNIPFVTECPMQAVYKISSSGVVPKFIYVDQITDATKIYPQVLPANSLELPSLCSGVNNATLVVPPNLGSVVTESGDVVAPDCGTPFSTSGDSYVLAITPYGNWTIYGTYTSAVNNMGIVTLNISLTNSTISIHTLFSTEHICDISMRGVPNNPVSILGTTNPNLPSGSVLGIGGVGQMVYSGYETSIDGGTGNVVIEFFNVQYDINN